MWIGVVMGPGPASGRVKRAIDAIVHERILEAPCKRKEKKRQDGYDREIYLGFK